MEYCGTIKSVKYLCKYTYKGHDCAALEVELDEIKRYVDARYVGPPEACWRLLEFDMHGKSHTIDRLAVHLRDDYLSFFQRGCEREALQKAEVAKTMLTA